MPLSSLRLLRFVDNGSSCVARRWYKFQNSNQARKCSRPSPADESDPTNKIHLLDVPCFLAIRQRSPRHLGSPAKTVESLKRARNPEVLRRDCPRIPRVYSRIPLGTLISVKDFLQRHEGFIKIPHSTWSDLRKVLKDLPCELSGPQKDPSQDSRDS